MKIGETKTINGKTYVAVEGNGTFCDCHDCDLDPQTDCISPHGMQCGGNGCKTRLMLYPDG